MTKTIEQMADERLREQFALDRKKQDLREEATKLRMRAYELEREADNLKPAPEADAAPRVNDSIARAASQLLFGRLRTKVGEDGDVKLLEDTALSRCLRHLQLIGAPTGPKSRQPMPKEIRRKTLLDDFSLSTKELGVAESSVVRIRLAENPGFTREVRYVSWCGPTILQTVSSIPLISANKWDSNTILWDHVWTFWERKLDEGSDEAATWLEMMKRVETLRGNS